MSGKVTIITGPQGSGNHLFAKVLSQHPDVGGWKDLHHTYWLGHDREPYADLWQNHDQIDTYTWTAHKHHVISISCPYVSNGETTVPNYCSFIQRLEQRGLTVNIGIIGRDVNILRAQQQRVRGDTSLTKFFDQLDSLVTHPHVFLSHELLALYQYRYLKSIATQLNIPIADEHEISPHLENNANEKYITYLNHYWLDDLAKQTSQKWR